jgi:hypothetical protein
MGPKMDSLLYAILGSLLRNRFVSPLWIRQCFPASSPSFSLLLPLPTAAAVSSSFFTTTTTSTIMPKPKATAEELEARAESKGYKR